MSESVSVIVYQAVNRVNGKRYIGITRKTLKERILKHKWSANRDSQTKFAEGNSQAWSRIFCFFCNYDL